MTILKAHGKKFFLNSQKKIEEFTGKELIETLTSDFSTTTSTERIASQITIMEAMKSYFKYSLVYFICGIPEITIEGNTEDWERIIEKAKKLEKYDLGWWINELIPILEQFVKASKNEIDVEFWRNMFKYHTPDVYGAPDMVDGWITKFFPYDKEGNRTEIPIPREIDGDTGLPEEVLKVDLDYIKVYPDGKTETIPLELWSGFIGLEQNDKTFALRPKIGWMIRKKDVKENVLKKKLEGDIYGNEVFLTVIDKIPEEIIELDYINNLVITFKGEVNIPDKIKKIKIDQIMFLGKISYSLEYRILKLLPKTEVIINNTNYLITKIKVTLLRFIYGKIRRLKYRFRTWLYNIRNK